MNRPRVALTESVWRFPDPAVIDLDNGLTVWHFPIPGQHVAAFELVLPVALSDEPRELEGVGTVALQGVDESTHTHPDIAALLDLSGAALHGRAHLRATKLGGLVPARRLHDVLPLFAEVLREPAYLDSDVALHIEALEASYRTKLASPGAAARWAFRLALYGHEQRHGRPVAGSPETLERISRDDVVHWHAGHFTPKGATLIFAGDIPDLDLTPLETWTGTNRLESDHPVPTTGPGRVVIADVPGSVQATVVLGHRSISRTDPRWAAARLAGHIMTGGFASRLNLELRERLGYTYGVSGGFVPDTTGSTFQIATNTRTDVVGDAVARILDGLRLANPFTDAELTDAKAYRIGIAPLANETSADIAGQASVLAEAGLPTSFVNDHTDQLKAVTVDDINDVWRELVDEQHLVVAVAGDAEALQRELQGFGPEIVELV